MKRWHDDVRVMRKQARVWHRTVADGFEKNIGQFRKKHALDCGKTDCHVCHYEKIHGIKTHKQVVQELTTEEQIREFGAKESKE